MRLLRDLNVTRLSFVLLTHPHADHFRGLHTILNGLDVDTFYSFPMRRDMGRLKKAGQRYLDAAMQSGDPQIKADAFEYVKLITVAHGKQQQGMDWQDLEGPTSRVRPQGFSGVDINAILPFKKVKGEYFNALDANRADAVESPLENSLSVALDIAFGEYRIGLCADATKLAWMDHRRELQKSGERLSFSIAKLPHHGSAIDCDDNTLDYLYDANSQPTRRRFGLISASGNKHHPAGEVLRKLKDRSVWPYCTNLSVVCGNNIRQMLSSATVDPQVVRWLNVYGSGTNTSIIRQPCQGDICVTIPSQGEATVSRQFDHPCAFRGDFDFISP